MTMNWVKMLFVGDSLTYGSRDRYGLAWPYYMVFEAYRADKVTIIPEVVAEPGITSGRLARLACESITKSEAKEMFLMVGTNDAKDEEQTPLDIYRSALRAMINWGRMSGKRVYLIANPLPAGFGSPGYTADIVERIREYNAAVRELCDGGVVLIDCEDIRGTVDGIHFTVEAARAVAERAWDRVKEVRSFE